MASKVKKDPLSRYFKDLDEFDISSGEESEDNDLLTTAPVPSQLPKTSDVNTEKSDELKGQDKSLEKNDKPTAKKLPSAHDCLKSQSSPAFLRLSQQKEVDWDKNVKNLDQPEGDPTEFNPNAVPPPTSYEPVTDSGTKVVDKDGNKRKRIG